MTRIVCLISGLGLAATLTLPACSGGSGGDDDNNSSAFSSGLPSDKSFATVTDADVETLCNAWAEYALGPGRDASCRSRAWGASSALLSSEEALGCGGMCTGSFDGSGIGDVQCTQQCQDAEGQPVCEYTCAGTTQAEVDQNCAEARVAACTQLTDAELQQACADAETECHGPIPVEDVAEQCTFLRPASTCTATVAEFEACVYEEFLWFEDLAATFPACSDLTIASLREVEGGGTVPTHPEHTACATFNEKCPGVLGGG